MEHLSEIVIIKMLAPFIKVIYAIGGWFASLLVLVVNPEQLEAKETRYRLVSSMLSVPATMAIDSHFVLNKWTISVVTIFLGLFMWLIIDIAKKKVRKKINDYIDKI